MSVQWGDDKQPPWGDDYRGWLQAQEDNDQVASLARQARGPKGQTFFSCPFAAALFLAWLGVAMIWCGIFLAWVLA